MSTNPHAGDGAETSVVRQEEELIGVSFCGAPALQKVGLWMIVWRGRETERERKPFECNLPHMRKDEEARRSVCE